MTHHPHLEPCTPLDCPTFQPSPKERIPIFAAVAISRHKPTVVAWEDYLAWCDHCGEETRNREGLSAGNVRCDECGNPRDPE